VLDNPELLMMYAQARFDVRFFSSFSTQKPLLSFILPFLICCVHNFLSSYVMISL
jgi:hypothetical protein